MKPLVTLSLFLVRTYQFLFSPDQGVVFPHHVRVCRFYPSCSVYTIGALQTHGFFHGWWLGIKRIARCNPWNTGDVYDPVGNCKL